MAYIKDSYGNLLEEIPNLDQVFQYDDGQWKTSISQQIPEIIIEDRLNLTIEGKTFTITKDHIKAFLAMVEESKPEYFV